MKFNNLDAQMRIFETIRDVCTPAGIYMTARIDGRNFTRLTKEICKFEAPFDIRFRDLMAETVRHLMQCGFSVLYGYTESDEISLLFSLHEDTFSRKHRKFNSILASEAAAKFSVLLGQPAAFDCRICELTEREDVVDYFRWRMEDASRNALNAYCYWKLREDAVSPKAAAAKLSGMSLEKKADLLAQYGVIFDELPLWQTRGTGFYFTTTTKTGRNPLSGTETSTLRRQLVANTELPAQDAYGAILEQILKEDCPA